MSDPPVKGKSKLGGLVWGVGIITQIMATEFIQTPKSLFSNFTVKSTAVSVACQRKYLSSVLTCGGDKCDND